MKLVQKIGGAIIFAILWMLGFFLANILLGFARFELKSEKESNIQESKALQFL